MRQHKHVHEDDSTESEAMWSEDEGALCQATRGEGHGHDEESLLSQLVSGQSLMIIWGEEEPIRVFEEIVRCTTCGEGLTEVRLALFDPRSCRCPTCGRPASA